MEACDHYSCHLKTFSYKLAFCGYVNARGVCKMGVYKINKNAGGMKVVLYLRGPTMTPNGELGIC